MPAAAVPPLVNAPLRSGLLRSMGVRAAINQFSCFLIAVILWLFKVDTDFVTALVFSMVIGNCCWLLIDGGRALAARWVFQRHGGHRDWPGWPWMVPNVVIGASLGYVVGQWLSRWLLGWPAQLGGINPAVMLFSVIAALTVSYLFYARERVHAQNLQAIAAERLASETQLKLLQSQLEPHMLFNTLANLRVLIGLDPQQAQAMLDHLIAFLRTTLASTRVDRHALVTEFEALNDYLALMKVRMGERLQSRFELPADLCELMLPPLLLQPLVENAIKHGLEPKVEGGRLEITAARVAVAGGGEQLRLRVRDTGIGLAAAAAAGRDGVGTQFGLEQVRQRLARLYGERASLTISPLADAEGGTEAIILLPPDAAP